MATTQQQKTSAAIGVVGFLVALLLYGAMASPAPPPATTTTTRPASTTTAPTSDAARPLFSPTASWNRTAAELGYSTRYASLGDIWWTYGGGGVAPPATVTLALTDYSVPIYDAADATTSAYAYQAAGYAALFGISNTGLTNGAKVPWNYTWRPAPGNDALMVIVDRHTDEWWELGGVNQLPVNCAFVAANITATPPYDPTAANHLCLGGIQHGTGLYGLNLFVGRGMGNVPKLALITRADEVASGTIRHALEMTSTATMWGAPECGPNDPGAGDTCGYYLAPATRVEWNTSAAATRCAPTPTPPRSQTVPEGTRLALDITDAELDAWATSRGYTGQRRTTALTFARALRDYGWVIAETGCYGNSIETDGTTNPATAATWARLGLTGTPADAHLLDNLFAPGRIRVVNPTR